MSKTKLLVGVLVGVLSLLIVALAGAAEQYQVYLPLTVKNWPLISTRPPTPLAGRVLFSEVMANPPGAQPDQEWFELYNDGGTAFDLTGYRVGDEEDPNGNEGMMQFPDGTRLQPGQVVVIARKALAFAGLYGFAPDFELDETDPLVPNLFKCDSGCRTTIVLTDGGDELLLYDPAGDVVDALAWGNSPWPEFDPKIRPPVKGQTLERYPAYQDGDNALDWRSQPVPGPRQVNVMPPTPTAAPTFTPAPTRSPTTTPSPSPTATSTPTPTFAPFTGQLLISEVQADPLAEEPGGEWIELYNPSEQDYPLAGFKIGDEEAAGGSEGMMAFPAGAQIDAGQVMVIANRASVFVAVYGFKPDFELNETDASVPNLIHYDAWASGSISLVNGGDEVLLLDGTDQVVDGVAYGDSPYAHFQPPVSAPAAGSSIERYPPAVDTDAAGDWRIQASPAPGQVDLASPPTPTPLPPLVINEIHADPHLGQGDANGDGVVDTADDEFVEIVNTTDAAIDLSGWVLHDGVQLRHTFAISTVLPANCAVVVFGGGLLPGTYGESLVFTATTRALGLNNTGDTLTLFDASAAAVITTTYGSDAGDDQAITRSPDVTGLFARHTLVGEAAGRRFSPGTRLNGTPFAGCGGQAALPRREEPFWAWGLVGLVLVPGLWRRCWRA